MLVVFLPIFMAATKIIYGYYFVDPLRTDIKDISQHVTLLVWLDI